MSEYDTSIPTRVVRRTVATMRRLIDGACRQAIAEGSMTATQYRAVLRRTDEIWSPYL